MKDVILPPVSDQILQRAGEYRAKMLQGVIRADPAKLARDSLDFNRARELFARIKPLLPDKNARLLEIGSGYGTLVTYAARWEGIRAFGVEPNPHSSAICRDVQKEAGIGQDLIPCAVGEALPFASETIDLVCSFNVLEHTADPAKVLAEAVRVLKPGGYLYFSFPNYGSWWEGHYAILWLPHIPKAFARIYVRLWGRNPQFLNHLQLIDYRQLMGYLGPLRSQVQILDVGQNVWADRLRTAAFSEWAQLDKLKTWVKWMQRFPILLNLIVWIGCRLHWETPFILVLQKHGK